MRNLHIIWKISTEKKFGKIEKENSKFFCRIFLKFFCPFFQKRRPKGAKRRVCTKISIPDQIRLDFNTFVISGPSTFTNTVGKTLFGHFATIGEDGATVSNGGQCLTDTFSIGPNTNVPVICGINTGDHVYFDTGDTSCHSLDFQFGNVANYITSIATRSWNIKITQYSCNFNNLAPSGCTQYFYGTEATNKVPQSLVRTLGQKPAFYPEITLILRFQKCKFYEK